jgi:glycosyltransferase involved in cell wall biosynthesis
VTRSLLSIIVPAYKPDFLAAALQSLVTQSVHDFDVVIADDCSPSPLADVVSEYQGRLRVAYHRFPDNLGGLSLAAQWSRSVRLARSPWIWLFSDDDLADPHCVEVLLLAITGPLAQTTRVFHFNTRVVDDSGTVIRETTRFPRRLSTRQFLEGRMTMRYSSFACEYAFSMAAFDEIGGFVDFPAGWCSDDASWIALAGDTEIVTLDGAMVSWRRSAKNISSPSSQLGQQKSDAMIAYVDWLAQNGLSSEPSVALRWFSRLLGEQQLTLGPSRCLRAARSINRFDGSPRISASIDFLKHDLLQLAGNLKARLKG